MIKFKLYEVCSDVTTKLVGIKELETIPCKGMVVEMDGKKYQIKHIVEDESRLAIVEEKKNRQRIWH